MVIIAYVLLAISAIKILFMFIFRLISLVTRCRLESRIRRARAGRVDLI